MSDKADELWDVLTKDRQKTGKTHRRGDKMNPGEYHLVVHACIFNSSSQLLVQQRQTTKKVFPNMWDLSASGCVLTGETSSEAIQREVFEELGLRIDFSNELPYFSICYQDGFDDFYLIQKDDIDITQLVIQKEEVKNVKWATKEEVLEMKETGIMIPYYFLNTLFQLLGNYSSFDMTISNIKVQIASFKNVESWMSLIEIVRDNFPGLETDEKIENYRKTLIEMIGKNHAICALHGNIVVGALLFSTKLNQLCFLAVHPEYRRKKIASKMFQLMLTKLDRKRDIVVETFREGDEKGAPARALYSSLGFVPGELCLFENKYPEQKFILKATET